ncbi:MAG: serine hydrolase [Alphaproteobacteria bacterium]
MFRGFIFGLAVYAMAGGAMAGSSPSNDEIMSIIKQRVDEKRASGIVVGVLDADGKNRVVAYGDPGPGAKPLGAKSVFEIGSVTKTFTATLLADMVVRGEVKLEDPVQKYEHPGVTVPSRNGKQIELVNLAMQDSGLPRLPTNLAPKDMTNPYADYTVDMLHGFLNSYQLPRDPGEKYEYSNLGGGLLGHVLAYKAGTDYEALVKARILKPLHMDMSGIALSPDMTAWLAKGHTATGALAPNWDIPTLAGAGALRSNAEDMLKFMAANIHPPKDDLGRAMALAQAPRRVVDGGIPQAKNEIGLIWMTVTGKGGGKIVWHNGETGGYHSFIGFDPKTKKGVVVLANSAGSIDDIGFHLIVDAIPLTPAPPPPREHKEVAVSADTLKRYVGEYQFAPTFAITIRLSGNQLTEQATGQPEAPIYPESETDFFLKVVDAQISFVVEDGKVTGLILHQNGRDLKANKVK